MRIISGTARGTKLYTLEGNNITRPTLDRVKESVFNILQNEIENKTFLDLFSGSGAIGLEAASRGAKKSILCDKSKNACEIIHKNIEKTHMENKVLLYNLDYKILINKLTNEKIDIIYIDPPYDTNLILDSIKTLIENNIITENTLMIIETDNIEKIKKQLDELEINIIDNRKYGRANIIFAKSRKSIRKG